MIGKAGDQNNSFNGDVRKIKKDSLKFFVKIFHFGVKANLEKV